MPIQIFFGVHFYKLPGGKVLNLLTDEFNGWEIYASVRSYLKKRVLTASHDKTEHKYQDVMVEVPGQD